MKLAIGTLLLIFGLQWLRKAVLRSSGRKALHDEAEEFVEQTAAARQAGQQRRFGLDWFSFVISFKGVFLEGVEVVFIVITFGLSAGNMPIAIVGASVATVLVVIFGALAHGPLTRVPENTLKYGVGLLLATFGTYWAVGGLGILSPHGESLEWPGSDLALIALLAGWYLLSRVLVKVLRRPTPASAVTPAQPTHSTASPYPPTPHTRRPDMSFLKSFLRGFGQFWYDFIIGDDWKIAVALVIVLAAGAVAVVTGGTGSHLLVPLLAVGLAAAFTTALLIDTRKT